MFKFAKNTSSIATIWHNSFDLYKQTFAKVWYLALIMAVVSNITNFVKISAQQTHIPTGTILLFILMMLVVLFISAIIMHRIYNLAAKPDYNLSDSISYTLSKYFILLASTIGLYVAVLIPAIVLLIIFVIIKPYVNELTIAAGFFLWLLLAIYLAVSFMFNIPSILFDEKGWLSALKTSFKLVQAHWWRTFVIILLPMLVMVFIQMLFAVITKNKAFTTAISLALSTVILPFIQALILVQFNDLKLRFGH